MGENDLVTGLGEGTGADAALVGSASEDALVILAEEEPGRRTEILAAALRVFSRKGYGGGSMREIATDVGVTEPALYRHFPGKEALFATLVDIVGSRVRTQSLEVLGGLRPEGLREQLVEVFAGRRRMLRLYAPALRTIVTASMHEPRFIEEYRSVMVEPVRARLIAKAAELDEEYGIVHTPEERDARVRALMALVAGYLLTSVVLEDHPDAAIADAVLRVMGWEAAG